MKKSLAVISIILSVLLIVTSCGAASDFAQNTADIKGKVYYDYAETESSEPQSPGKSTGGSFGFAADMDMVVSESKSQNGFINDGSELTDALEQRKIIYSSNFRIQTTEFDAAVSALSELCEKYGAYYESSNQYGTAEKANRNGSYTVRVPVQNYNAFRTEAGNIGTVIQSSENNRDVTENYFDTEARLESAKLREERLLEILKTADTLDNVLLLESELANVRYEIESMSGTLRKYDSLISYSTVSIEIDEVIKPVDIKAAPRTFGDRISQATISGFSDFSDTLQDIAVYISYNLPAIIIFAVFVIIIVVIIKVAVRKARKKAKTAVEETKSAEKE